ncbi:MAG: hypothetical protein NVSMB9_22050 [Isosphaeraceae bacterium]
MRFSRFSNDAHEAEVGRRFDLLHTRFKNRLGPDDARLQAIRSALEPVAGMLVLDLGCGKGRFAAHLRSDGARVVGLDLSASMLAEARGLNRVLATARRLPFADRTFDAVVAVEVFEHLVDVGVVLGEVARVLRPEGMLAIVDKNACSWNSQRPWLPNLALKWLDERRGRWMYPVGGPAQERWFWPGVFRRQLAGYFREVRITHLLSPDEKASRLFRIAPGARLMTLWTARVPGRQRP